MNFVTDTHALLWHFINSPELSPNASEIFDSCELGECIIFIPSIVIAEALSIFDKNMDLLESLKIPQAEYTQDNFLTDLATIKKLRRGRYKA